MTRVLIATNQPVKARGLEALLNAGGLEVVAVCQDVFEIFECLHRCVPDIAILDEPVVIGPEVVHDLRRMAPRCHLLHWPELRPSDSPARVVEALLLMANFSIPNPSPNVLVDLACAPVERQVVALAGYGLNPEEMAAALGSDRSTVQKLIKNVTDHLGTEDRYDLALYGLSTLNQRESDERRI